MSIRTDAQRKAMFANMAQRPLRRSGEMLFAKHGHYHDHEYDGVHEHLPDWTGFIPVEDNDSGGIGNLSDVKASREEAFDKAIDEGLREPKIRKFIELETGKPFTVALRDPGVKDMYYQLIEAGSYVSHSPDPGVPGKVIKVPKFRGEDE